MKKYLFFITLILSFLIFTNNIYAAEAEKLMQCDYNAPFNDGSVYVKYRIIYYNDGTIYETMPQNMSSDYTEKYFQNIAGALFRATTFSTSDDSVFGMIENLESHFSASSMEEYYDDGNGQCPFLAFKYANTTFIIEPVKDKSLHDPYVNYIRVSEGVTTLFNEEGEQTEPTEPKITNSCAMHTRDGDLDNIPGITLETMMYDNGEKYINVYFGLRGASEGQLMLVKEGEDVVATPSNDHGEKFTIIIYSEEVEKLFKQNFTQINNNTYSCPSPTDFYLIEESFNEKYYSITTDKQLASEYPQNSYFREGVGGLDSNGTDTDIKLDFTIGDCNSYLGYINNKNDPAYYLNFAFQLIKYIAIVLLFVLSVIDFAKATASNKDDAIKKAIQTAIKRIIIAIIIFFLPILINFLLDLLGIVSTNPTCGIV